MTSTRGGYLRSLLMTALAVLVSASGGARSLWAQAGLGPDPFKPYNRQYDPYTYPMGPASPAAGQGGAALSRMGNAGANQFQGFLDEMSGGSRERYGIGVPYYRSAVDPDFDPKGNREYRPNEKADRAFDQGHELVTRKYVAYLTEHDPKKRAALLREYNRIRAKVSRAMSARTPSRALEAASGTDPDRRRTTSRAPGMDDLSTASGVGTRSSQPRSSQRSGSRAPSGEMSRRGGASSIPPPPPIFGTETGRRSTSAGRTPAEVLDRSRRINSADDAKPGPDAVPGLADPRAARQPAPSSPPPG
jgi:hypothetical protein